KSRRFEHAVGEPTDPVPSRRVGNLQCGCSTVSIGSGKCEAYQVCEICGFVEGKKTVRRPLRLGPGNHDDATLFHRTRTEGDRVTGALSGCGRNSRNGKYE